MTPPRTTQQSEIRASARLISLLRLLMLAVAVAILTLFLGGDDATALAWQPTLHRLQQLLLFVALAAAVLIVLVPAVKARWQLALHLVFDLLWIAMLIYLSGGVGGPAVPLVFAVVLTGNLVLPGVAPFVMPALGGLVLAVSAALYLAGQQPFDASLVPAAHPLVHPPRILVNLGVQVGALFLVDLLGQTLARRLHEQSILTGELIEQLDEGVLATDRRNRVLYANAAAGRLLGTGAAEPGREVSQVLSGEPLGSVRELLGGSAVPAWDRVVTDDGRQLMIRVHALIGRRGRTIGRILLISDETRLRALEDDAARAQRLAALGQMAAGIAHEVRNPLASLRGCSQELGSLAQDLGRDEVGALCDIMIAETDRMARIVEDFLELSRARPPDPEPLPVADLLQELDTLYRRRAGLPPGIELRIEAEDGCPPVLADPDQIRQVLINLVNNAVDAVAGRPEPRVVIRARAAGDSAVDLRHRTARHVRLVVADNGVGIPPEDVEQVFTPFYSTKSQGTGLGLSMVDRLVRDHHGRIEIASTVGEGTEVTVILPAVEA